MKRKAKKRAPPRIGERRWLQEQIRVRAENTSYRALEEKTGVDKAVLCRFAQDGKGVSVDTFLRLVEHFDVR